MKLLRSVCMAFLMYSHIPVPLVEWRDENMAYAMCFFPLVGVIEGAALLLWCWLCGVLGIGAFLFAAGAALLPVAVNGGIHMDGFCDCCDALASHQTKERKLEIMKDSGAGAFAVICCCAYFLLLAAFWSECARELSTMLALAVIPVLSRAFSGLAVVSFRSARTGGLLATFSKAAQTKSVRVVMVLWLCLCAAAAVCAQLVAGAALIVAGLAFFAFYRCFAYRQFGGITGDTAGWFLQLCELICLAAAVFAQKIAAIV